MTTQHPVNQVTLRRGFLQRFEEYLEGERVFGEMALYAPAALNEIVSDLETPLSQPFERQVARHLAGHQISGFMPSKTLMPLMLQRFEVSEACQAEASDTLRSARKTCDTCPVVGRCWHAMRRMTDAETCREFCPNAETFDTLSGHVEAS